MDKPAPAKYSSIAATIAAILSYSPGSKIKTLFVGMPTTFPTPKENHTKGMRRKAKVEGRKHFTVSGRKRKI